MRASLILPTAGSRSRFGGPTCKQLLPLAGTPVLLRSLTAFSGLVDEAVVVVSADIHDEVAALFDASPAPMPVRLTLGGATRMASVHNGLRAATNAARWCWFTMPRGRYPAVASTPASMP